MRVKGGPTTHARHKKIIKAAKGFRGRAKNCYTVAKGKLEKAWAYAYRDRRNRKREFRALWIQRINAAARSLGLKYGEFMAGLKSNGIDLNRKVLSEMAIMEQASFEQLVSLVKNSNKVGVSAK